MLCHHNQLFIMIFNSRNNGMQCIFNVFYIYYVKCLYSLLLWVIKLIDVHVALQEVKSCFARKFVRKLCVYFVEEYGVVIYLGPWKQPHMHGYIYGPVFHMRKSVLHSTTIQVAYCPCL
jgi:hypothetical protein